MRTLVIGDIHGGLRALQIMERAKVTKEDTLIFLGDYVWLEPISAGSRLLNWIEYDKQLRLYSWQPWWIIIALVKRQQRQSYVVQARRKQLYLLMKSQFRYKTITCWLFTFVKRLLSRRKEPSFVHAGFTNMNGVTYEFFPKLFYWDRTLWETALSLDQRIKPTIYFIQND
jgi:serine/threonine protein phosphatase 1